MSSQATSSELRYTVDSSPRSTDKLINKIGQQKKEDQKEELNVRNWLIRNSGSSLKNGNKLASLPKLAQANVRKKREGAAGVERI